MDVCCASDDEDRFTPKKNPELRRRSSQHAKPPCPRTTSNASSNSRGRAIRRFPSRPTTRIGIRRPISRFPAKIRIIPCASPTISSKPSKRTAVGADHAHQRRRRQGNLGPRSLGTDRLCRLVLRRPGACSSIPPSTSGIPAVSAVGSTHRTRAPSICSSTTRRAISRRSILWRSKRKTDRSISNPMSTQCGCGHGRSKFRS